MTSAWNSENFEKERQRERTYESVSVYLYCELGIRKTIKWEGVLEFENISGSFPTSELNNSIES
mgnify:CR=1 FL=1